MMSAMPTSVVLVHGFTNTGGCWDGVAAALGPDFDVLAPDWRGHGRAADERPIGLDECAGDIAAAAPDRFVLGGYSMGGRIALHLALSEPRRVEALVLVGATAGIADSVAREARAAQDAALADEIERSTIEEFADRWARNPMFKGQGPEVDELARADRLRNRPAGLAAALRALGQGACEPRWSRLGELAMPVVLVVGERDSQYRKLAERMAAAMPRAEVLVVPATGHAVHLEAPAIVAQAIAQAASLGTASC
jgi:2-succinyl-6-hydroxy-2,4-cyclohexadiene-1-carboxylate synthase